MVGDVEYRSHFGVYAWIADAERAAVLLIKKALGPYTGMYDLPGGTMEPHELLEETLHREVAEETGCTVTKAVQMGAFCTLFPYAKDGQKRVLRHIGAIYAADVTGTPFETSDRADDSHGAVWVALDALTPANAAPLVLEALKHHVR